MRESFKQTASNLAKVLRKQWPGLVHLIQDKSKSSRSRRSSNIQSNDGESLEGGGNVLNFKKDRTQSMNSETLGVD